MRSFPIAGKPFEGCIRSKVSGSVCSYADALRTIETQIWGARDPETENLRPRDKES